VRVAAPAHSCARDISAPVHVIVSIDESALLERILAHAHRKRENSEAALGPPSTEPPVGEQAARTEGAWIVTMDAAIGDRRGAVLRVSPMQKDAGERPD
jgi:hypothetical protein